MFFACFDWVASPLLGLVFQFFEVVRSLNSFSINPGILPEYMSLMQFYVSLFVGFLYNVYHMDTYMLIDTYRCLGFSQKP